MAEMTPMMRQYMEIKEQNKDSILFFRLGDFYEMFGDDARKASRELDLTLTTRDKDKNKSFEEKIPMSASRTTPPTPISPGSLPRATRWLSASRRRILPPPRGWWSGTSSAS